MNAEKTAQIFAFTAMTLSACIYVFSPSPWISIIPGITALAYWNMIQDRKNIDIYRYSEWILTTPLMLLVILLKNDVTSAYINIVLVLDALMIGCGYFGKSEKDRTKKTIWFIFGCIILLPILYVLLNLKIDTLISKFTVALWLIYPIVYILNANYFLTDTSTNIGYALLDVTSKVGLLNLVHN